jgi:hypothetical protein
VVNARDALKVRQTNNSNPPISQRDSVSGAIAFFLRLSLVWQRIIGPAFLLRKRMRTGEATSSHSLIHGHYQRNCSR